MADQYAKPDIIIRELRQKFIDSSGVNESLVFMPTDPAVAPPAGSDIWYNLVWSPQGRADLPNFDGGGELQVTFSTRWICTAHSATLLDDPDSVFLFMTQDGANLWIEALKFLKAYARDQYAIPNPDPATVGDFPDLLNEPMRPSEYSWQKEKQRGWVQIAFDLEWDWDLFSP